MPYRRTARTQRGTRKGTDWFRRTTGAYVTVAAASKVLVSSGTPSNPGITETIVRTRGGFSIASDQAGASESQIGAMGLMVVNDLALAAGAASIPGPVTDRNDDGWFVWEPFA